jgi:aspartokinase-like uncharacterized kinase
LAKVHLPRAVAHLVGGALVHEIDAEDYRGMMAVLDARWPGLRLELEKDHAVVLDGDIIDAPLLEAVGEGTEVHFITRLGGG